MAISGVDRLLQVAREFGVEPSRNARGTQRAEAPRPVDRRDEGDGIRLSLSTGAAGPSTKDSATARFNATTGFGRISSKRS